MPQYDDRINNRWKRNTRERRKIILSHQRDQERGRILHNHCCENLKSYKSFSVFEAF
jgi:hypothetical protein